MKKTFVNIVGELLDDEPEILWAYFVSIAITAGLGALVGWGFDFDFWGWLHANFYPILYTGITINIITILLLFRYSDEVYEPTPVILFFIYTLGGVYGINLSMAVLGAIALCLWATGSVIGLGFKRIGCSFTWLQHQIKDDRVLKELAKQGGETDSTE